MSLDAAVKPNEHLDPDKRVVMMMVSQHVSTMTKSHHGGNMSVMIKVGMCQCQNPTMHDKL